MLKLTRLLSATVFCFVGFHTGFGSVGHNISKVGWFSLYNIWKCTYRQQCNQGIYCRNACWYCALILVVLSLVSSITIWSYWVSYGSEFPYFCGIPDMPNDLPQHQSRQNLLLLLMRSTDMMETFWHLVLIMSIYRHSIFSWIKFRFLEVIIAIWTAHGKKFLQERVVIFDASIIWFSCELGPGVLYIICFI